MKKVDILNTGLDNHFNLFFIYFDLKNEFSRLFFHKKNQVRLKYFMRCGHIKQRLTVTRKSLSDKRPVDYVRKECII